MTENLFKRPRGRPRIHPKKDPNAPKGKAGRPVGSISTKKNATIDFSRFLLADLERREDLKVAFRLIRAELGLTPRQMADKMLRVGVEVLADIIELGLKSSDRIAAVALMKRIAEPEPNKKAANEQPVDEAPKSWTDRLVPTMSAKPN